MKIIQRPFFFLLWSAKFALSQTDAPLPTDISQFPVCAQQCLESAASAYCLLDSMIGCVCQRNAVAFFQLLSFCVNSVCSTTDGTTTINMVVDVCLKHGYNNPTSLVTLNPTRTTLPPSSWTMSPNPSRTETTTSNPTSTSTPSKGPVMSTAAIIGIVVGGVAVIGIIAFLIVFCMRHRAQLQAMAAVPPPPPAVSQQPLQPPPGYPSPMEPLMQGYNELEQPVSGYYAPHKEVNVVSSLARPTAPTPVPLGYQGQSFQELPAQQRRIQGGQELAQGSVFVEMPGDNRRR